MPSFTLSRHPKRVKKRVVSVNDIRIAAKNPSHLRRTFDTCNGDHSHDEHEHNNPSLRSTLRSLVRPDRRSVSPVPSQPSRPSILLDLPSDLWYHIAGAYHLDDPHYVGHLSLTNRTFATLLKPLRFRTVVIGSRNSSIRTETLLPAQRFVEQVLDASSSAEEVASFIRNLHILDGAWTLFQGNDALTVEERSLLRILQLPFKQLRTLELDIGATWSTTFPHAFQHEFLALLGMDTMRKVIIQSLEMPFWVLGRMTNVVDLRLHCDLVTTPSDESDLGGVGVASLPAPRTLTIHDSSHHARSVYTLLAAPAILSSFSPNPPSSSSSSSSSLSSIAGQPISVQIPPYQNLSRPSPHLDPGMVSLSRPFIQIDQLETFSVTLLDRHCALLQSLLSTSSEPLVYEGRTYALIPIPQQHPASPTVRQTLRQPPLANLTSLSIIFSARSTSQDNKPSLPSLDLSALYHLASITLSLTLRDSEGPLFGGRPQDPHTLQWIRAGEEARWAFLTKTLASLPPSFVLGGTTDTLEEKGGVREVRIIISALSLAKLENEQSCWGWEELGKVLGGMWGAAIPHSVQDSDSSTAAFPERSGVGLERSTKKPKLILQIISSTRTELDWLPRSVKTRRATRRVGRFVRARMGGLFGPTTPRNEDDEDGEVEDECDENEESGEDKQGLAELVVEVGWKDIAKIWV